MTTRRDKAEFLDNLLKLFNEARIVRVKDLELKDKDDYYTFFQTVKHLKILEDDGLVKRNVLDEYYLESTGPKVLNDIENLGYLAKHKTGEAEYEEMEEDVEKGDWADTTLDPPGDVIYLTFELIVLVFTVYQIISTQ